jgi:dCMP deaminase
MRGDSHCEDVGCLVVDKHCVRTNHAEINALAQAAKKGHAIDGATAYVASMPCTTCAKVLIAGGITRVVVFSDYHDALAMDFFAKAKVKIDKILMPSKEINYDLDSDTSAKKSEHRS